MLPRMLTVSPTPSGGSLASTTSAGSRLELHLLSQYVYPYIFWLAFTLLLIVLPHPQTDQVIFWYREYPKAAVCPTGTLPRNSAYPADAVFAYALLSSPATVTLDIGTNNHYQWNAPAGASMGQVPFPTNDNQIPYIQIIRNNVVVKSGYGSLYVTKECTGIYNFNFWVGSIGP